MSDTFSNTAQSAINPPAAEQPAVSHVATLLQAIAEVIGQEHLSFGKNGFCDLTIDGEHAFSIVRDDAGKRIAFMGTLATDFSIVSDKSLLQELLVAAMGPIAGGDGIGMVPNTSVFILYRVFDAGQLDGQSFAAEFHGFVARYMQWLDRVQDAVDVSTRVAAIPQVA